MINSIAEHAHYLIFGSLFTLMYFVAIRKNMKYSLELSFLSNRVNLLVPQTEKESVDIKFDININEIVEDTGTLVMIGDKFRKGYDFMLATQPNVGYLIDAHKHFASNEMFYVIEGSLQITSPCECRSLDKNTEKVSILNAGDYFYVKRRVRHKIKVLKPVKFIVIAKPPLFTRVGRFYDKLFKKKN